MKKNLGKSIWAVLAGVMGIIIATTLVDIVPHIAGIFPRPPEPLTDALALPASSYRLVIGVALGPLGVVLTWNAGLGPRWYPISPAVLAIPQCWFGGWLRERRVRGGA